MWVCTEKCDALQYLAYVWELGLVGEGKKQKDLVYACPLYVSFVKRG